ncbi:MAG: hypothetical protein ACYDGY_09090 [Acidimicrobiales bacterium]
MSLPREISTGNTIDVTNLLLEYDQYLDAGTSVPTRPSCGTKPDRISRRVRYHMLDRFATTLRNGCGRHKLDMFVLRS